MNNCSLRHISRPNPAFDGISYYLDESNSYLWKYNAFNKTYSKPDYFTMTEIYQHNNMNSPKIEHYNTQPAYLNAI